MTTLTTPDPAHQVEVLRALWAWLRPAGCRLTLAEALRHPQYSIVLKCAARRGRQERRRDRATVRPTQPTPEPDLFSETP